MDYRLTESAEDQIDALLLDSARKHGLEAAGLYGELILIAMRALGNDPRMIGSVEIPGLSGILAYPLRHLRQRAEPTRRVSNPRHLLSTDWERTRFRKYWASFTLAGSSPELLGGLYKQPTKAEWGGNRPL